MMGKQIISAIIGAAIAVALMIVLERAMSREFGWTVIPIGILTGLGAAWGANSRSITRGALAAVIALAAFIGGKVVASQITQSANSTAVTVNRTADSDADADDEDGATPNVTAVEDNPLDRLPPTSPLTNVEYRKTDGYSTLDTAWLVIGTLLAYFIGCGKDSGPAPVSEGEPSEPSDQEAPAEDQPPQE